MSVWDLLSSPILFKVVLGIIDLQRAACSARSIQCDIDFSLCVCCVSIVRIHKNFVGLNYYDNDSIHILMHFILYMMNM